MSGRQKSRVNDFVVRLANVNGTGSASANGLLMKAIFRMGIPVMGKNFFPSNIQGLPTWYEIRITKDGHLARAGHVDIMVAMNAETYQKDLSEVAPGGTLIYDSTWPRGSVLSRPDITIVGVPLARMCNEHFSNARARTLMKNMAYVGALAALLDLDRDVVADGDIVDILCVWRGHQCTQEMVLNGCDPSVSRLDVVCPIRHQGVTIKLFRFFAVIDDWAIE